MSIFIGFSIGLLLFITIFILVDGGRNAKDK
jgi:hypothetical protein